MEPALGLIETKTIVAGIELADALCKRAPVVLRRLFTLTPGKMIIVFTGDEAPVEESWRRGLEVAGEAVLDSLFLPAVEPRVAGALFSGGPRCPVGPGEALGAVETLSVASCVVAADVALKAARVDLIELRLRRELGGKGYFLICGSHGDTEAALEAAALRLAEVDPPMLAGTLLIPRPHDDMLRELLAANEASAWS
ncbi:MAG: BMC domain-containing protein [Pseudomonadota bacterium]